MEASTLQKKKNTISKGKLKKSLKNVLCRPDQVFWPEINEDESKRLQIALKKHKINIPEFNKPHWKDLKVIPKDQRPKPPKLKKVEGLILGLRECKDSIQNGKCSAVIIEAKVNPRIIVQPVLEMCINKDIPALCFNDLRKITASYLGVSTSCLGIKYDCLLHLQDEIVNISKNHPKPKLPDLRMLKSDEEKMDIDEIINTDKTNQKPVVTPFNYLYRTNKKSRVFVPTSQEGSKTARSFIGQDFIEFSDKPEQKDSKAYMKMLLKRISNNPDRVKKK